MRSEDEYNLSFILGTILLSLDELKNNHSKLNKNEEIVVSCKCGYRSQIACKFLLKNGFNKDKVYNFKNGIDGWTKNNLPVVEI